MCMSRYWTTKRRLMAATPDVLEQMPAELRQLREVGEVRNEKSEGIGMHSVWKRASSPKVKGVMGSHRGGKVEEEEG